MEGGPDYTCMLVDGAQVAGAMPPMMEGVPPHWNVYFYVEAVDETVAKAAELGGSVLAPAFDVAGRGPDGRARGPAGRDVQRDDPGAGVSGS